ncbi:hypothetical protein [Coleofasciculus sp. F4-SAH-05]|uniref:hypothetical protein n=1 Tax=Coleofasciculus sp. F4-SAH-05 TaxID=3069525 RepID=UPI0032FD9531
MVNQTCWTNQPYGITGIQASRFEKGLGVCRYRDLGCQQRQSQEFKQGTAITGKGLAQWSVPENYNRQREKSLGVPSWEKELELTYLNHL